jgi:hypothetical protein
LAKWLAPIFIGNFDFRQGNFSLGRIICRIWKNKQQQQQGALQQVRTKNVTNKLPTPVNPGLP